MSLEKESSTKLTRIQPLHTSICGISFNGLSAKYAYRARNTAYIEILEKKTLVVHLSFPLRISILGLYE